jgi:peptidoglycan/xylan/chitin deacetylase (PgdA/CDA1 family)
MIRVLLLLLISIFSFGDGHIFVYHRFDDNRYPTTNISTKTLRAEFNYLRKHNYKVVSLDDFVKKIEAKEKIPNNWVAFTIDDGFKSFYTNGLKVFREYNFPFTLFVAVKYTEEKYKDYVSWKQLKEIAKYGKVEFHSYSHGHYGRMSSKAIRDDIEKGLSLMKKYLDYKPNFFVYPYGEYNDRVSKIVKSYGFRAVFNQNMGAVNGKCTNVYDIDRSAVVGSNSRDFKLYLKFKELCGVDFIAPKSYPKNRVVKNVYINLADKSIKEAQVFISGHGWKRVKVKDGKIRYHANKRVNRDRIKIGVKVGNRIKLMVLSK